MQATRSLRLAAAANQSVMPTHIIPEARSTYRALLRASSKTFAGTCFSLLLQSRFYAPCSHTHSCLSSPGDKPSQTQFRSIIRATFASPTLSSPLAKNTPPPPKPSAKPKTPCETYASSLEDRSSSSLADKEAEQMSEAEYQERLKHWREVAAILRQNVVQGQKVEREARERQEAEKAEGVTGEEGNVWSTCDLSATHLHALRWIDLFLTCFTLQNCASLRIPSWATTLPSERRRSCLRHRSRIGSEGVEGSSSRNGRHKGWPSRLSCIDSARIRCIPPPNV
jgi:hypothetical protein